MGTLATLTSKRVRASSLPCASLLLAFGLAWLGLAATEARAQDFCVPEAVGVPGTTIKYPNWWDDSLGEPDYWPRLDDPRWRGTLLTTVGGTSPTEHVSFRAARHGSGASTALLLSWWVKVDFGLAPTLDVLRIAFSPTPDLPRTDPGWVPDALIEIVPFTSTGGSVPRVPDEVTVWVRNAGTGLFEEQAEPANWVGSVEEVLNDTRIWFDDAAQTWGVNVRVPIDPDYEEGIDLSNRFKMWYEVQAFGTFLASYYRFPDGLGFDDVLNGSDAASWEYFRRDVASTDAACRRGISIAWSDIETTNIDEFGNPTPHQIKLIDQATGNPAINVFIARPLNEKGSTVPVDSISARLRLANWGTQPDWDDVPDPLNSLWQEIDFDGPPPPLTNGTAIPDGLKGSLTGSWTLTEADVCQFDPSLYPSCTNPTATRRIHQCMLVELSGNPGYLFLPSSAYRNMDFVEASRFSREAEVSVAGLAAIPSGEPNRTVYLYVQTIHMPRHVYWTDSGKDEKRMTARGGAAVADSVSLEDSLAHVPTYVVHAYHETGTEVTIGGTTYQVIEPQSSFGYYVNHDGTLGGWRHELEGAEEIAPNLYRIAVPEGGSASVTTTIEALGPKRFALSLHGGASIPHGDFDNAYNPGYDVALDLEYRLTPRISAEAVIGFHHFEPDTVTSGLDVVQVVVNGKYYLTTRQLRAYVFAGGGGYKFDPGGEEAGADAGVGGQWNLSPVVALEAVYTFHSVFTSGSTTTFSAIQAGGRIRF